MRKQILGFSIILFSTVIMQLLRAIIIIIPPLAGIIVSPFNHLIWCGVNAALALIGLIIVIESAKENNDNKNNAVGDKNNEHKD